MCVDDYPFRHSSAQRPKLCRKFVFVNEEQFAQTYYINISQFQEYGEVALCKILLYLSNKGLTIKNKKFFLPKFNAIIQPFTYCRILFEALDQKQLFFRMYPSDKSSEQIFQEDENDVVGYKGDPAEDQNYFCRVEDVMAEEINDIFKLDKVKQEEGPLLLSVHDMEDEKSLSEHMADESEELSNEKSERSSEPHRKPKEAERVIGEVILAVKLWRQLYESKKCNLTVAAKVVGISKKSLDDYYLVLRTGQIFQFDFSNNLNSLMGNLRSYIKAQGSKISGKLGKGVKCFKLVQELNLAERMEEYKVSKTQMMKQ